ncbi:MAG: sulfotransferase [Anaerolineae bacterium]|nr:sulfotransferase [Anaerolineae bacterium]
MSGPDFLCIGAQKAGTTWLYANLGHHPAVWLPPVKEIHYFDRPSWQPLLVQAVVPKGPHFRQLVLQHLKELKNRPYKKWHFHFLLLPRSERWYTRLFSPSLGRLAGDITPAYSRLSAQGVARIHRLLPEAKIIYILRNPVERMWSYTAMYFYRWHGKQANQLPLTDIERVLLKPENLRNGDYVTTWQTWRKFYSSRRLYVGFFEQLVQHPAEFLKEIYGFLEIDAAAQNIPENVAQKQHVGPGVTIPPHWARYLTQYYYPVLVDLHKQFDNAHTASWLVQAEEVLQP